MNPEPRLHEAIELERDEMRRLGYLAVDMLVEHLENLRGKTVTRIDDWASSRSRLGEPFGEEGLPVEAVLDKLRQDVFSTIMHVNHPRFFAFVPGPGNFVGAVADALAAGFNVFAGTWMEGSGPATVELITVDWLRSVCGMPEGTLGLFVSGGSVANLTGLAVARRKLLDDDTSHAVAYCSDQTHSSLERALRLLGIPPERFRRLPCDGDYRLRLDLLARAVAEDRDAGLRPFCVIANAGTTNTGSVDPLPALAGFCRQEGLWLHADGAYGAAAALSPRGHALLEGLGEVDSLAIDPHKWLFQPFEMGCVLVRQGNLLKETFRILPEYLQDVHRRLEVNFCDYGIQLTRSFRALKLWMSLRIFGVGAFRKAIEHGFDLAEEAERALRSNFCWEVVSPARMGVICFRYRDAGASPKESDAFHTRLVDAVLADGYAALTSTVLNDRTVLRMCTINPRTSREDIAGTISRLEYLAAALN